MNDLQRTQIKRLRADGFGYIKIAQALGLSENTVKSYCRRNGLIGISTKSRNPNLEIDAAQPFCRQCGKELYNTSGHRQRIFCGADCRRIYWKENQTKINRKSAEKYVCPVCHNTFEDYAKSRRKYCSHACYIAGRYKGGDTDE